MQGFRIQGLQDKALAIRVSDSNMENEMGIQFRSLQSYSNHPAGNNTGGRSRPHIARVPESSLNERLAYAWVAT